MEKNKVFATFTKPHKKFHFWGNIFVVLSVVFMLILAQVTQLFIDSVYTSTGTTNANFGVIWTFFISQNAQMSIGTIVLVLSVVFVVLAILKSLCTFGSNQFFFAYASRSRSALRRACFKKLSYSNQLPSPQKTFFNLTSDVTDFADAIYRHQPKMVDALARVVLGLVLCFFISPTITFAFVLFVPLIFVIGLMLEKKLVGLFSEARNRKSDMFGQSEELIKNIFEIKIFSGETWATKKYHTLNSKHTNTIIKSQDTINKHKIWLNVLRVLGILVAFSFGATACFGGILTVGYFVLIMAYAIIIFDACVNFMYSFYDFKVAAISAKRLQSFLSAPSTIKKQNFALLPKFDIEIKNLCFEQGDQKIFEKLSISFPFGTHTAVTMQNDQAKTILARLLLRLVDPTRGEILYNKNPHTLYEISSLRKGFSFATQEPAIFEGTILDNITMFEKPDSTRLWQAIELCDLKSTIDGFLDKEKHFLSESGKNLPAQVRQKIALARAVYRNAPVLLLDNAFNKFSGQEGRVLAEKIIKFYEHKTVIFLTNNQDFDDLFSRSIKIKSGGAK